MKDEHTGEIHYVVDQPYWNQGIMTEAATHVIHWAFSAIRELQVITAYAREENIGSWRVMEKSGMSFLRYDTVEWPKLKGQPRRVKRYAIARSAE